MADTKEKDQKVSGFLSKTTFVWAICLNYPYAFLRFQ